MKVELERGLDPRTIEVHAALIRLGEEINAPCKRIAAALPSGYRFESAQRTGLMGNGYQPLSVAPFDNNLLAIMDRSDGMRPTIHLVQGGRKMTFESDPSTAAIKSVEIRDGDEIVYRVTERFFRGRDACPQLFSGMLPPNLDRALKIATAISNAAKRCEVLYCRPNLAVTGRLPAIQ